MPELSLSKNRSIVKIIGVVALFLVALYVPFWVQERNWLTPLNLALAFAVGAIGMNILLGFTGQLSLAYPFFMAVGAYGYSILSANHDPVTREASKDGHLVSAGLHPIIATIVIVIIAGALGACLSPIAGRLKGIYLGIATLGLVFMTDHLLQNLHNLTGGFNGRRVPVFSVGFSTIARCRPKECQMTNILSGQKIPWGAPEKLWYLQVVVVALAFLVARNMMKGRPGRALQGIRDGEIPASVMGVNLTRYRAMAFTVSAMYAGLSGVLYALANGNVTPVEFEVDASVAVLAMVVIGGLGSIGGSIVGALFVKILPDFINRHAAKIQLGPIAVAKDNQPTGLKAFTLAKLIFGALIVILLLFEDGGLAALWRKGVRKISGRRARELGTVTDPVAVPESALAVATAE